MGLNAFILVEQMDDDHGLPMDIAIFEDNQWLVFVKTVNIFYFGSNRLTNIHIKAHIGRNLEI